MPVVGCLFALSALTPAVSSSLELQDLPTCVRSWPEARFRGYGYLHIVHLANDCRLDAHCDVATNVNPKPVSVVVPASHQMEVVTYKGSPSRLFRPTVSCELATATMSASRGARNSGS